MSFNWLWFLYVIGVGFYVTLFSLEWCPFGREGTALLRCLRFVRVFIVEGVPSVAFDAQCSPGPANSL